MVTGHEVTVLAALVAGLLLFLSPCTLLLFPSFLAFVAGISFEDLQRPIGQCPDPPRDPPECAAVHLWVHPGLRRARRLLQRPREPPVRLPGRDSASRRRLGRAVRPLRRRAAQNPLLDARVADRAARPAGRLPWCACDRDHLCRRADSLRRPDAAGPIRRAQLDALGRLCRPSARMRARRTPASGSMVGPATVDMAQALVLMERPQEGETNWLPSVPLVFPCGSVGNDVRLSPMLPV